MPIAFSYASYFSITYMQLSVFVDFLHKHLLMSRHWSSSQRIGRVWWSGPNVTCSWETLPRLWLMLRPHSRRIRPTIESVLYSRNTSDLDTNKAEESVIDLSLFCLARTVLDKCPFRPHFGGVLTVQHFDISQIHYYHTFLEFLQSYVCRAGTCIANSD